ncbi:AAA family ATPase [Streptomyces sp. NPDC005281]|uniref:ATP-binding protein n=1 Tax=Streptomyces sp. NPDC005281 TaxID=3155712 RepID=UPI0033AE76FD
MATVFVDRTEHIAASDAFLRAVAGGEGGVLVVRGEQGMGKSALLREVTRNGRGPQGAPKCRFVQARCIDRIGTHNAYGPVIDVLAALRPQPRRSLLRRLGRSTQQAAPELLSLVPALGPLLKAATQIVQTAIDSPAAQPDSMAPLMQGAARAVASALEEAATASGPTVIVLDDVQWLDPSSMLVLEYLVERLHREELAVGLLLGHRTDPGADSGVFSDVLAQWELRGWCSMRTLTGLPHAAVADLVRRHHPGPVAPSLPARLSELTKGHPVFVTQCLGMLSAAGDFHGPLPDAVGPLIRRRLDGLDPEILELLVTGATQGETFDSAVVAAVSGQPPGLVAGRLHRVSRRHGLIRVVPPLPWAQDPSVDYYRFENALVQMAVLDEQSAGQARKTHARIAAALAGEGTDRDDLPIPIQLEIARHYHLAQQWDDAARTQFALARKLAMSGMSFWEAEALSRQAVDSIRRLPPRTADRDLRLARAIELLLSLTEARWQCQPGTEQARDLEGQAREAEEAARRSGDAALMARTAVLHGRVLLTTQGLWPCLDKLREAVELARVCADPIVLFAALSTYGGHLTKQDLAAGLQMQLEAESLLEDCRPTLGDGNDPIRQVRTLGSQLQLGVNLFDTGYLDQARDLLTRCVEQLRTDPLYANLPVALNYLAQLYVAMGSEDEAAAALREARDIDEAQGGPSNWHAYNTALLALLLSRDSRDPGERMHSRVLAEEAWHEMEQTWKVDLVPIVRNLYAEVIVTLADGDTDELGLAARLTDETVRETEQTGMVRSKVAALSLRSRIHLIQGETAAASRHARQAIAILEEVGDLPALRTEEVLHHAAVVLRAADGAAEADELARQAREVVARKADLIHSPADRDRFLREVPLNRAILNGYGSFRGTG